MPASGNILPGSVGGVVVPILGAAAGPVVVSRDAPTGAGTDGLLLYGVLGQANQIIVFWLNNTLAPLDPVGLNVNVVFGAP